MAEVLHGVTQIAWGTVELNLPVFVDPATGSRFRPIRLDNFKEALDGIAIIRVELVFAFVLAIVAFVGFILFFRYTSVGLAMRATSEDQQLAQSVGLRVRVILAITWAVAAFLASIAGVLQGGAVGLSLNISFVALRVFPAVLLGRSGVDRRRANRRDHHRHRRAIWNVDQFLRTGGHESGALCRSDAGAGDPTRWLVRREAH